MALLSAPTFFPSSPRFLHPSSQFTTSSSSSSTSTYSFSQLREALSDVKIESYVEVDNALSQAFASARGRSRSPLATADMLKRALASARSRSRSPFPRSAEPCIRRHSSTGGRCMQRQNSDPFEVRLRPHGPPSTFNDFGLPNLPLRQK